MTESRSPAPVEPATDATSPTPKATATATENWGVLYRLTSPGPGPDDRDFVVALTDDYMVPELANVLPGPWKWRRRMATTTMHGLQRVFIGDHDADALGIPDVKIKHVLACVGPALSLASRAQRLGGERRARARVERAYRAREAELERMRAEYRLAGDPVDAAPDAARSGQPAALR